MHALEVVATHLQVELTAVRHHITLLGHVGQHLWEAKGETQASETHGGSQAHTQETNEKAGLKLSWQLWLHRTMWSAGSSWRSCARNEGEFTTT